MKKFLIAICMAAVSLCGFARSEGDMGVGVDLGVAPCVKSGIDVTNFGFGLKYQYYFSEQVRGQANLEYWFRDKGVDVFDVTVNGAYLIDLGNKLSVYPTAGLGYGNIGGLAFSIEHPFDSPFLEVKSKSLSRFVFNIGMGAEYDLSDNLTIGFEFKYRYMKDFGQLPINLGITYHF